MTKELNGYETNEECPDYRRLHGQIVARDIYTGQWKPVRTKPGSDGSILEQIRTRPFRDGIAAIEALLEEPETDRVRTELNQYGQQHLAQSTDGPAAQFSIEFDKTQLQVVQERVRTMIHEWAAKAETSEVTASGGLLGREQCLAHVNSLSRKCRPS